MISTRDALLAHSRTYPLAAPSDLFKFLHQSTFGCEHLVADEESASARIRSEAASLTTDTPAPCGTVEALDGAYARVSLSLLSQGLDAQTLGRLFCLSATHSKQTTDALERRLAVASALASEGLLPFSSDDFETALAAWRAKGYPALHHSETFRAAYRPAYRVIANCYLPYLPLLLEIDRRLTRGTVTLAIEGGSASGKSTLGELLERLYGCTVLHMDDFFLRPDQRTPERLAEVGGNLDRERFAAEVLAPLRLRKTISYRRYDCASGTLLPPVDRTPTPLTVIEGAYSMHPDLASAYDLTVFLDASPELQRARILVRNSPALAKRFFEEWIPMENRYFEEMRVRERCDLVIEVG